VAEILRKHNGPGDLRPSGGPEEAHREPAARGMPADKDVHPAAIAAKVADQIDEILDELIDMIDIATPWSGSAVAADIRNDDLSGPGGADHPRQRMKRLAVIGRAMPHDQRPVRRLSGPIAPVGQADPVARRGAA